MFLRNQSAQSVHMLKRVVFKCNLHTAVSRTQSVALPRTTDSFDMLEHAESIPESHAHGEGLVACLFRRPVHLHVLTAMPLKFTHISRIDIKELKESYDGENLR